LELLGSHHLCSYNPRVHFVYIVRCADGTLYTGYARDPQARVKMHNAGRGARYTSGRRPVRLIYAESFASIGDALRRERALKRRSRAEKEALIGRRVSRPRDRRRSGKN
jgi:putative endonuclease